MRGVTMSKRYGNCQKKHAEVTIKSVIRGWAKERESFDGIKRSKKEIEEIVAEQFEAIDNRGACNWIGCDN
jgi:hypothetical protein